MSLIEESSAAPSIPVNLRREWVWSSPLSPADTNGAGNPHPRPGAKGDSNESLTNEGLTNDAQTNRAQNMFTVMTYNILADCHIKEGWYPYCPESHLKMTDRHEGVMVEVQHYDPDIVCMQEVGTDYYTNQLVPAMKVLGYQGVFFPKVQGVPEGEATFFKTDRYELLEQRGVSYNQLVKEACEKSGLSSADMESVLAYTSQDNVLLLTRLFDRRNEMVIPVGNTHLHFGDYKNIDITTMQAGLAIQAALDFAGGPDQLHLLCGDFNQEPLMPGYHLLHDGKIHKDDKEFIRQYPLDIGGQRKSLLDILPSCFQHSSTDLKSAYEAVVGEELPFSDIDDYAGVAWPPDTLLPPPNTTPITPRRPRKAFHTDLSTPCTEVFIAALDYQWFSERHLRCQATVEMVDEREIFPYFAMPNQHFPSDHLPVICTFQFLD